MDVLFGARRLDVTPILGWQFRGELGDIALQDRTGRREGSMTTWDAIVGVKGRASFGDDGRWFVALYVDVGTGASRFTWQA